MPLFREWNPDLHSLAAIWQIGEPEAYFAGATGLDSAIRHAKRRMEFLAGRFLLQYLKADFPLRSIAPDEHDKPQLPEGPYHFSLSHSYPYVAAVVSTRAAVGIDIQCWHDSILALQPKFLSATEQQFCNNDPKLITLAWSAKEAAYKYQGRRGVDFIGHLPITEWQLSEDLYNIVINLKMLTPSLPVGIKGFIFNEFALCLAG